MAVSIVRLGKPRAKGEGLRIGTVRRPPRGVPASHFASDDWYDVWYPELSPSPELVAKALAASRLLARPARARIRALRAETDREWAAFVRGFRAEMRRPEPRRTLDLLAALSHTASFSVGCYCEDEARCHRSVLRELLAERGASIR
jgi:uncharacterized protein YeaO (DUF488 family)